MTEPKVPAAPDEPAAPASTPAATAGTGRTRGARGGATRAGTAPPAAEPAVPATPAQPAEAATTDQREPARPAEARPPGTKLSWLRAGFFAGLGLAAAYGATQAIWSVRDILVRVLIALFLAISLDPAVRWLTRRGVSRGLAVTLILAVFLAVVTAFLWSIIPPLVRQFDQFVNAVPGYIQTLQEESSRFRELNDRYSLTQRLQGIISGLPTIIGGSLLGITGWLLGALANSLTVIVLTIYFMLDLPRLLRNLPRLAPPHARARVGEIADVMVDKVGAYMIGQLTISSIAGLAALAALQLVGAAAPLPLAIVVAGFALVPLIGATLGAVVVVAVTALTTGIWPQAVVLAVFFLLYQQLENYVIAPRVLRSAVNLSAAAVLLAGLIGATALDLLGALMAIPVAAALKVVILQEMDKQERLAAQQLVDRKREAQRREASGEAPTGGAPVAGATPAGSVLAAGRIAALSRLATLSRRTRRRRDRG